MKKIIIGLLLIAVAGGTVYFVTTNTSDALMQEDTINTVDDVPDDIMDDDEVDTNTIDEEDTIITSSEESITNTITNTLISIVSDTTAPVIEGVENSAVYKSSVTPIVSDEHLASITLTRNGEVITYNNGDTLSTAGVYVLVAIDTYNNVSTTTFTIKKISTKIELITDTTYTYDGNEKYLTARVIDEYGNIISGNITYTYQDSNGNTVSPVDNGVYTVTMSYEGSDTYESSTLDVTLEITPATLTVEVIAPDDLNYDGNQKEYSVVVWDINNTDVTEEASITYVYTNIDTGEVLSATPSEVGDYTLGITITKDNYSTYITTINFSISSYFMIGEDIYNTLSDVLDVYQEGDTIVMYGNQVFDGNTSVEKDITINLNGYTLELSDEFSTTAIITLVGEGSFKGDEDKVEIDQESNIEVISDEEDPNTYNTITTSLLSITY